MLKTIFPTIISVPRVHNTILHYAIDYADQLDVVFHNEEFQELLETYPESPEIRYAYLDSLFTIDLEGEEATALSEQIRKINEEHPDNLWGKIIGFYSKIDAYQEVDVNVLFEQEFDKEIDALLHDKPYPVVVPDTILLWMMRLMMTYCVDTNNKAGVEKMFLMIRSMQWYDGVEELSLIALGENIFQDELDEYYDNLQEWHSRISEANVWADINIKPHHDIFYRILNRPIKDFADEDILAVLEIQNREKIVHDIRWLLDQGCHRILQLSGKCNCDFILQATYLIAHFQLKELAPLITRTLTGTPETIFETVAGDFSGEVLLPWVYSLGKMDLTGWWELMTYEDIDEYVESIETLWYCKIVWLNALAKISSESGPQSERAKELMNKVWSKYQKSDYESLGWLMYFIVCYGIDTYDARIKEAYENNRIELYVHGTYEDVMEDKGSKRNYFAESHVPVAIGDNYQEIIKYVRKLETEYQPSSADTVAEEMEYFRKNAENKSDFGDFLDHLNSEYSDGEYDSEYSDGEFSAVEMALLEMLEDDDSYSQDTTATIIPIKRDGPKVGRNDPCPCGSGKKYKKCCL